MTGRSGRPSAPGRPTSATPRRRPLLVVVRVVLLLALAAGCRVETEVGIEVEEDGSGLVEVGIGLDADALARVPGIADELRVDDLRATGWTVTGPAEEADGLTWLRISKPFGNPEEASVVLDEVTGAQGALRGVRIERLRGFGRTGFTFAGTVDLGGGLEAFGDAELAASLDGEPLGEDVAAIEARYGATVDELFGLRVTVRLPGDVSSNAPEGAGGEAAWAPRFDGPGAVDLRAESSEVRPATFALVGIGALAALAALGLLGRAVVVGRRPAARRRHAAPRGRTRVRPPAPAATTAGGAVTPATDPADALAAAEGTAPDPVSQPTERPSASGTDRG